MDPNPTSNSPNPYYEAKGKGCDEIMRCYSCRSLVTARVIAKLGMCPCGSTRVTEVRTLTDEEREKIASGEIKFADSDLFLAEFAPVDLNEDDGQPDLD